MMWLLICGENTRRTFTISQRNPSVIIRSRTKCGCRGIVERGGIRNPGRLGSHGSEKIRAVVLVPTWIHQLALRRSVHLTMLPQTHDAAFGRSSISNNLRPRRYLERTNLTQGLSLPIHTCHATLATSARFISPILRIPKPPADLGKQMESHDLRIRGRVVELSKFQKNRRIRWSIR